MKDKISVALATYNGERYLREQLDSLYSQTLVPDEIVVSDDFSTDNTISILEEYHLKYGLFYHINEINLGINKNFERAITLCSGDYIALCDQDDVWMAQKIEKSYKKLKSIEDNMPSLVSSRIIEVDVNLNELTDLKEAEDSDSYVTTLFGHHSQGCTLMMNRALLKYIIPIPSDFSTPFDFYIGLTAAMVGNKYNIAEPLMYYRQHLTNVKFKVSEKKISVIQLLKNTFNDRYPFLIPEERLYNMRVIAKLQSQHFISERTSLYKKLLSLEGKINLPKKIEIIYSIKELPLSRRFLIIMYSVISHMFRVIIKI